jgi:DNA mismatch endonuclease (patch repair protein)
MDNLSPKERSAQMAKVRSKDTKPEMFVRRLVYSMGYRYRLHRSDLPGKPDMVFGPRRKVIFIHGCFWHGHYCSLGRIPKSRVEFWTAKIVGNRARDEKHIEKLRACEWQTLTIWECQIKDVTSVKGRIKSFLG